MSPVRDIERLLRDTMGLDAQTLGANAIERAVRARLAALSPELGEAPSYSLYWQRLQQSAEELQALIEAVVVPETWFFRHREAFRALAQMALDERAARSGTIRQTQALRLLSLPCATGEEPYSIAMTMFDAGFAAHEFSVDALDISERALAVARPHLAVDPVVIGSSLVMALQTVVARNIDPTEAAVVTVGTFHAGFAPNVIPEDATLEMSVRSFSPKVRATLEERIRALVTSHAEGYGASADIEYIRGYPVLVNTEAETEFARSVAEELVGAEHIISPFPPIAGSEDFAYYLQKVPGCFIRLGNGEGRPMLHNAKYDFNDDNLTIGAAFWTRLVERFLSKDRA